MDTSVEQGKGKEALMLLGLVVILTLVAGFLPANWFGIKSVKQQYARIDLSDLTSTKDITKDLDGDGKIDWGEFVQQTYSGSAQDIAKAKNATLDQAAIADLNDPNNLTGSLAKNAYVASAYLKQTGTTDSGAEQDLMNKLIQQETIKITNKTYTLGDIDIDKKETPTSVKAYGNALGKLLREALGAGLVDNDAIIYKQYLDTKDQKAFDTLSKRRDEAQYLASELSTMKVPLSAAVFHLVTLNRTVSYANMLNDMLKVNNDPLRSTVAFGAYQETMSGLANSILPFLTYFQDKNITFTKKEPGYVFDPHFTIYVAKTAN